ncbi:MAG: DUF362 domain-containing protein [Sedimentisphaerales bacterium]|nr:DUF362 domain-containing protein [Sedimentisphaerales bacterium]
MESQNNNKTKVAYIKGESDSVQVKVKKALELLGGIERFVRAGKKVLLKPNFVAPFKKATTSFELIKAVVEEVRRCNAEAVIAESSGYEFDTELTFKTLGVYELGKELNVEVLNLDKLPYKKVAVKNGLIKEYLISDIVFKSDVIINLPRMKRHSLTDITLGVKNLFGFLSRQSRRLIHSVNLNRGIAQLCSMIKTDLTIVDASSILETAVYGNESRLGSIIASEDILAADRFCCELLDIDPDSIAHIKMAGDIGIGRGDYEIVGEQLETAGASEKSKSFKKMLRRLAYKLMFILETSSRVFVRRKSILPYFHYYFGIRPVIDKRLCNSCGACRDVCPVGAIDIKKKTINNKCMHLRCLKCVDVCPVNAIKTKGFKGKSN